MDEEKIKNVGKEKNAGLMFPYFILITINPGKSSEIRNAIHLKRRRRGPNAASGQATLKAVSLAAKSSRLAI